MARVRAAKPRKAAAKTKPSPQPPPPRDDAARANGGKVAPRATPSAIPIKAVYERSDLPPDLDARTPPPGAPPYTRGIHSAMYRARPWTMRQYAGFGSAAQTNQRFRYLLDQGQTGLSVAFDLPTQMGFDSDHPRAEGEAGKTGAAIDTLADMRRHLDGIPPDRVTTPRTINPPAPILLLPSDPVARAQ